MFKGIRVTTIALLAAAQWAALTTLSRAQGTAVLPEAAIANCVAKGLADTYPGNVFSVELFGNSESKIYMVLRNGNQPVAGLFSVPDKGVDIQFPAGTAENVVQQVLGMARSCAEEFKRPPESPKGPPPPKGPPAKQAPGASRPFVGS